MSFEGKMLKYDCCVCLKNVYGMSDSSHTHKDIIT